jgi:RNA polymerase-binding transcription factor DksA
MEHAQFKDRLEKEKAKLENELQALGRKNPENPADWEPGTPNAGESRADPLDVAERTTEFDTNASIVADLETRYNDVVAALTRMENGTYGICEVAQEPIDDERLEADPAARTCRTHLNQ